MKTKPINDKILKDYILGCRDEETVSYILSWIKESEENKDMLFRLEEILDIKKSDIHNNPEKIEDALNKLRSRILSDKKHNKRQVLDVSRFFRYAAVFVSFVFLAGLGYWGYASLNKEKILVVEAEDEVLTLNLSDGSKVWLNKFSILKYPESFKGDKRLVFLEGEAYFEVSANPDFPFIVSSSGMDVKAVGTTFNFNTSVTEAVEEVSLMEGNLYAEGKMNEGKVMILPGQKVILDKVSHLMTVKQVNSNIDAVWHDNLIPLRNAHIDDIVTILERLYSVNIVIGSDVDRQMTYSGFIVRNDNIDSVLNALTYSVPINYHIEGNHVFLNSKK